MAWRWYLDKPIRRNECTCHYIDGRRFLAPTCNRHSSEYKQAMEFNYKRLAQEIKKAFEEGHIK